MWRCIIQSSAARPDIQLVCHCMNAPLSVITLTYHQHHQCFESLNNHITLQGLELAVPGTYLIGEPVVTIAAFAPQLTVITSKQRPRRLTIHGSDGAEYMFLLKGHEDLRQVCSAFISHYCDTNP